MVFCYTGTKYTHPAKSLRSRADGELLLLFLVPRRLSIPSILRYSFVSHMMCSRSGDRSVLGITLPVGYLAMSLSPKFLTLMLSCLKLNPPPRVYVVPREQMNSEGAFWKDPPGYFEQLVYPAYVDGHRDMFTVRMHASPLGKRAHEIHRMATSRGGHHYPRGWYLLSPCRWAWMILSSAAAESSCRYFADLSLPSEMFHHFKLKSELCTKGVKRDGKAGLSLKNDILRPVLTLLRSTEVT
jgi:hypothetical protein